jgi:nickel superoxide dismutase
MLNYKKSLITLSLALFAMVLLAPSTAQAHCQVPCGIFDDHMRVQAMLEDAITIEKSMNLINELNGKTDALSVNQQVRWIMTKEDHAEKIIRTISDYFLAQRVKPDQKDYSKRLEQHHAVMVAAMKAKQSVDAKSVKALVKSIEALEEYYPEHKH